MVFFLTRSNLVDATATELRTIPKRVFGRSVVILPRGLVLHPVFWRLVVEHALTRYLVALAPFPAAMVIWPHLALPISQAPLLMIVVIWLFESHVISVPKDRRPGLIDADDAARGLDLLSLRATAALTRIATARAIEKGTLHLVVEQSEMARVPPLTLVSVQHDDPDAPQMLDLADEEERAVTALLFDDELTERTLHRINMSQSTFLRDTTLDPRSISAHARLRAMAQRTEALPRQA